MTKIFGKNGGMMMMMNYKNLGEASMKASGPQGGYNV